MKLTVSIGLLLAILQENPATSFNDDEWDYGEKGPETGAWCKISPICCNGKRQSPFVLYENTTMLSFSLLEFKNYDKETEFKMINNGKTVVLMENQNNNIEERPMISLSRAAPKGYQLDSSYIFHSMQFHWGSNSTLGSEHAFRKPDGKVALELQLIHYKSTFNGYDNAIKSKDKDALLIFSIPYWKKENHANIRSAMGLFNFNTEIKSILKGIPNIIKPGQTTTVTLNLTKLYSDIHGYTIQTSKWAIIYWYLGSMTTPPCKEIVMWYILYMTFGIEENELDIFRKLEGKGGKSLSNNFRPLNLKPIKLYEKKGKWGGKMSWLPRKF